jgi:ADP-ribose pyrophosphatase YjhB (NUDIX family)
MSEPVPRLGCGALILRDDGRILLVQRRRPPEAGYWGLPGGKVDFMEAVEDAVRREVAEETGLIIRLGRLLCVIDHFEPEMDPPQHWVAPVWLAQVEGPGAARLMEPHALSGLDWFDRSALPSPLTRATVQALQALGPGPFDKSVSSN